nr:glycine-rich protein DOT1-like [Aegilops tauschii subsp. strangulata]
MSTASTGGGDPARRRHDDGEEARRQGRRGAGTALGAMAADGMAAEGAGGAGAPATLAAGRRSGKGAGGGGARGGGGGGRRRRRRRARVASEASGRLRPGAGLPRAPAGLAAGRGGWRRRRPRGGRPLVTQDGPWNFRGHAVIITPYDGITKPTEVQGLVVVEDAAAVAVVGVHLGRGSDHVNTGAADPELPRESDADAVMFRLEWRNWIVLE